jgi:hypothetical protein
MFLLQIDVSHGGQFNSGAKKSGCKLNGNVWFANRSPSKVCRTICKTRSTKAFNDLTMCVRALCGTVARWLLCVKHDGEQVETVL